MIVREVHDRSGLQCRDIHTMFCEKSANSLKIQSRVEWMDGESGAHTNTHTHTQHCDFKNLLVKGEFISYIH